MKPKHFYLLFIVFFESLALGQNKLLSYEHIKKQIIVPSIYHYDGFEYQFSRRNSLIEQSSAICSVEGTAFFHIGYKEGVTEVRVAKVDHSSFGLSFVELSSLTADSSEVSIQGFKQGKIVTQKVIFILDDIVPKFRQLSFADYKEFLDVDEIRFVGKDLLFSIKSMMTTVAISNEREPTSSL